MTKRRKQAARSNRTLGAQSTPGGKSVPSTKKATCLALLGRPQGATITELQKATGWQAHSVRGFLAGTVKKQLGLDLAVSSEDRGRVYRLSNRPR